MSFLKKLCQFIGILFICTFLIQHGQIRERFYKEQDNSNDIFLKGDLNLTDSLEEYYLFKCTYDTPVYMIHKRGDLSQFILHSFYIQWTFFKEYVDHGNLTYVIFSSPSPFFIHSPCQHLDHDKFIRLTNDFDHQIRHFLIPTLSQSEIAFPFFFQPELYLPNKHVPYQASFHLNAIDPEFFVKDILPRFSNVSRYDRTFVTSNYFPLLRIFRRHFTNVTSYNFNRIGKTIYSDYLADVQSLGFSSLLSGKCNSAFFNIAYLYQVDYSSPIRKNVICIDNCNLDISLWLNENRC